jgi:hypothetical protein
MAAARVTATALAQRPAAALHYRQWMAEPFIATARRALALLAYWLTTAGQPHLTTDRNVASGFVLTTVAGLQFTVDADPAALPLQCPPMTVLTLVENAVRQDVDPAEQGGRIGISVRRQGERCVLQVRDTGVEVGRASASLGTGPATPRERLRSMFCASVELQLTPLSPHGTHAEVVFPIRVVAP